jgi:hypothetical protein
MLDDKAKEFLTFGQKLQNKILKTIDDFFDENREKVESMQCVDMAMIALHGAARLIFIEIDEEGEFKDFIDSKFEVDSLNSNNFVGYIRRSQKEGNKNDK